jgi:hypothetical protein
MLGQRFAFLLIVENLFEKFLRFLPTTAVKWKVQVRHGTSCKSVELGRA